MKYKDKELLLLLVNTVLNNVYETLSNHRFPYPLVIAIKEFKIYGTTIEGTNLQNGLVRISSTDKRENILKFIEFNEELKKVSENDISIYLSSTFRENYWTLRI